MIEDKDGSQKVVYSICISGAHNGITVYEDRAKAKSLGEAIAKAGQTITTGATIGLPYFAAKGAKEAGGKSIGFSPAVSLREHLRKYRLPYECYDFINFTGLNYVGRDLYLVQSSDAVITIGGGFGSLHEFTSALEAHKICGVLLGSGGMADLVPELMNILTPVDEDLIVYSSDPKELVDKVIAKLDEKYKDINHQLKTYKEYWFLDRDDSHRAG
jgi:uncharacterized protein (TIGR00725 family)